MTILLSSLNSDPDETFQSNFMKLYNFENLVKLPTSLKNPENPSCVNLFLNSRPGCSQDNRVFERCISDFHKIVVTVLKTPFKKQERKTVKIYKL